MTRCNKFSTASLLASLLLLACAPLHAQTPRSSSFLADHYDVSATLDPITQSLSAVAKVEFKAQEVSSAVRVELHPNLNVTVVKSAEGKTLGFERDSQNPLNVIVPRAGSRSPTILPTATPPPSASTFQKPLR